MSNIIKGECACSKCINRKDCPSYKYLSQLPNIDLHDWSCGCAKLDEDAPISIFDYIGEDEND